MCTHHPSIFKKKNTHTHSPAARPSPSPSTRASSLRTWWRYVSTQQQQHPRFNNHNNHLIDLFSIHPRTQTYRLNEFSTQVEAIRAGLTQVCRYTHTDTYIHPTQMIIQLTTATATPLKLKSTNHPTGAPCPPPPPPDLGGAGGPGVRLPRGGRGLAGAVHGLQRLRAGAAPRAGLLGGAAVRVVVYTCFLFLLLCLWR